MTNYKSTTKGKAAMKPQDFQCFECANVESHWEGAIIFCRVCAANGNHGRQMFEIFTPKNNSQRARVND